MPAIITCVINIDNKIDICTISTIEKWSVIGFYTLRVWFSMSGFFEALLTHNETCCRSMLDIGKPEDLKSACDKAAEVAIKSMTK